MNATVGWTLALVGTAIGGYRFGWQGFALCVSAMVFWLLLQFSAALRTMRAASQAPVGHVASAVMLNAKLGRGMRLIDVVRLTRSLGAKLGDDAERFRWADPGGAAVIVEFRAGRCSSWELQRPEADGA